MHIFPIWFSPSSTNPLIQLWVKGNEIENRKKNGQLYI